MVHNLSPNCNLKENKWSKCNSNSNAHETAKNCLVIMNMFSSLSILTSNSSTISSPLFSSSLLSSFNLSVSFSASLFFFFDFFFHRHNCLVFPVLLDVSFIILNQSTLHSSFQYLWLLEVHWKLLPFCFWQHLL